MAELQSDLIGTQSGDGAERSDSKIDTDSVESQATIHPVAAGAILAAGSVLSERKQDDWENRIDETMAQWDKLKNGKKN